MDHSSLWGPEKRWTCNGQELRYRSVFPWTSLTIRRFSRPSSWQQRPWSSSFIQNFADVTRTRGPTRTLKRSSRILPKHLGLLLRLWNFSMRSSELLASQVVTTSTVIWMIGNRGLSTNITWNLIWMSGSRHSSNPDLSSCVDRYHTFFIKTRVCFGKTFLFSMFIGKKKSPYRSWSCVVDLPHVRLCGVVSLKESVSGYVPTKHRFFGSPRGQVFVGRQA